MTHKLPQCVLRLDDDIPRRYARRYRLVIILIGKAPGSGDRVLDFGPLDDVEASCMRYFLVCAWFYSGRLALLHARDHLFVRVAPWHVIMVLRSGDELCVIDCCYSWRSL